MYMYGTKKKGKEKNNPTKTARVFKNIVIMKIGFAGKCKSYQSTWKVIAIIYKKTIFQENKSMRLRLKLEKN